MDGLSVASGVAGLLGFALQITQTLVEFGLDWKNAPDDWKKFISELQSISGTLEGMEKLSANAEFSCAFQGGDTSVLKTYIQGASGAAATSTSTSITAGAANATAHSGSAKPNPQMVTLCKLELEKLLAKLKKRGAGSRLGWERFKGAFLSESTRDAVEDLYRECQILTGMVTIDGAAIGGKTLTEVTATRKEQLEEFKETRKQQQEEFQETRKQQQDHHDAQTALSSDINSKADRLLDQKQQQERREILDWLTPTDYTPQQNDIFNRHEEGSGRWLLDSDEFKKWFGGTKGTLYCPGIQGAGKTILTSVVIRHLQIKVNTADVGIAYVYLNFNRQEEQTPMHLFLNLLKQFSTQEILPECVKSLYKKHKQTRPTFDEIGKTLCSAMKVSYSKTYILIDALDECRESDGNRWTFLKALFNLQEDTGANIFATSRVNPEIEYEFEKRNSTCVEIRASVGDMEKYIEGHMEQMPRFVLRDDKLQEEIKSAIVKAADGMFLMAKIHLDSLGGKRSPKAIKTALQTLPAEYHLAYEETMQRIGSQAPNSAKLALDCISWIACAKRRLTVQEIQHALAVEPDTTELDKGNISDIEQIVSVCAGLITVDRESNIIRFIHYTVQEFFAGMGKEKWFPNAHRDIAGICVTYLCYEAFEEGVCSSFEDYLERLDLHPLYDYSATHWGSHARQVMQKKESTANLNLSETQDIHRLIMKLLQNEAQLSSACQAMEVSGRTYGWWRTSSNFKEETLIATEGTTGLHLAALLGLREAVKELIDLGNGPDPKDKIGRTPLARAAEQGYVAVVKYLLNVEGVNPDSQTESRETPLSLAVENGHAEVVKLLLAVEDVEPNSKDESFYETPLCKAAAKGHDEIVKLLLAVEEVEPDSKSDFVGTTPLSWAAWAGHETVVKLLLQAGADPNSKDSDGWAPLHHAAHEGYESILKLLIAAGADPEVVDSNGDTPLSMAANQGENAVVNLLIATRGVNPNFKNSKMRTPVSSAAERGHEAVVRTLLNIGVNADSADDRQQTPLAWAAQKGHAPVVKLLLAAGVDPDPKDSINRTPLSRAAEGGCEGVVELLLDAGADPDSRDCHSGRTPLSWAAGDGHNDIVSRLLVANVDPNSTDFHGLTPLSWAAWAGYQTVVELLLAAGVNTESEDTVYGRTPLSWAVWNGRQGIVEVLVAEGADPDAPDLNGRTPISWAAGRRPKHHHVGFLDGIVKYLLTLEGVNPDSADCNGRTPISWAAEHKRETAINLLLAAGAKVDSRDLNGRTPLSWAAEPSDPLARALELEPIRKLLVDAGAEEDYIKPSNPPKRTPANFYKMELIDPDSPIYRPPDSF